MTFFSRALAPLFIAILVVTGFVSSTVQATEPPSSEEAARMREVLAMKGALPPQLAAEKADIKRRLDFVREMGNHRIDPYLLDQAINGAAQEYYVASGMSPKKARQIARPATPPLRWRGMPTTGDVRVFALLIDFSDHPSTNAVDFVNSKMFGDGVPADFPRESLANYYDRASYGQLDLSHGSTLGWYRPAATRASIPETTVGRENLIREAIQHFDTAGHDFSQYDNNGDGKIDYFLVVWSGPDTGWGNFWWGYQTSYSNSSFVVDGVSLGKYSWQWESRPPGGSFSPRVVIHETGHALGLPDYYDYDADVGPKGGVGGLDMMHGNWGDHACFSKWVLDWLTPTIVTSGTQSVTLRDSGTTKDCVVAWPGLANADPFSEMFIFQNRFRVANDTGWPTDGILAWHIDATLDAGRSNYLFDNSYTDHKLIRLMEADGLEEIELGSSGDAGDFYTAGQVLDPYSNPSTQRYSGITSGVGLKDIPTPSRSMQVTVEIGPQDTLDVTPTSGFVTSKTNDAPPSPASKVFALRNTGTDPLDWTASVDIDWVDLSATSGTLAAGETASVTVTFNANADGLGAGVHKGEFTFSNATLALGGYKRPIAYSVIVPPANDSFANAPVASGSSGTATANNQFATEEAGEPKHGGVTNGGKSVWWKWVPAASGEVTINTRGSDFDTVMSVYGGRTMARLSTIAFDDDGAGTGGGPSEVKFTAQAGMTYYIAVDGWNKSIGNITMNWSQSAAQPALLASILPSARSGKIGGPLSAFASVINIGTNTATGCFIAKPVGETAGFGYQAANAANALSGTADTPVDIAAGAIQNFVFQVTPDRALSGAQMGLVFDCSNTAAAPSVPGLNRLVLSSAASDVPDLVAVAATVGNTGIVDIPGAAGTGIFSAATVNIGAAGTFRAYVDDADAGLSLNPLICQTDAQSNCLAAPAADVSFDLAKDEIGLFAVFVVGQGDVTIDAANNRLFLRFEQSGVARGATSVAVQTVAE
jgi:M6 family metalloprotease-like protein